MDKNKCSERISFVDLINLFLREGAAGKRMLVKFVHPKQVQKEFIIKEAKVGCLNEDFNIIDLVIISTDCGESISIYLDENRCYFTDREEDLCEQCGINGFPGAICPFHMDMMSCHCPCSVSLMQDEKVIIIDSEVVEVL